MTTFTRFQTFTITIVAIAMQIAIAYGDVKNSELQTAIDAVDGIPLSSSTPIEVTKEAEALRSITSKLVAQNEIDDLVDVISLDPTERNVWQVVARALGGNIGFKKEQLPVMKRLFLASVRPGQHWLTEGRSGQRDYTPHQLRSELALQIHALVTEKRDIPDSKLLAEDPTRWLAIYLPERAKEANSDPKNAASSESVASQSKSQKADDNEKSQGSPPTQNESLHFTSFAAFLLAGIGLALLVWLTLRKTKGSRHP